MKRWVIYPLILAALFFAPVKSLEVGKLIPVEVVSVYIENGQTVIETDTENVGIGETALEAVQDLKDKATGMIFLDTAKYLLVEERSLSQIVHLREELKPTIRLCEIDEPVDLAEAVAYIDAHGQLPRLKEWETGVKLPVLSKNRNSLTFLKKVEKRA